MNKKVSVKMSMVFVFIVAFLFATIIVKLSYVALSENVDGINLKEFANNRNTKTEIIQAKRGNIYDNKGNTLASTVNNYTLVAYLDPKRTTNQKRPQHVVDKEHTAKVLEEVLGIDYNYAMGRLNKDKYLVYFGNDGFINESQKNKLEEYDLPGIGFEQGIKRTYSMGTFASYIIGYAKLQEDGSINGELGIESYYNKELSGINGKSTYQTDAYGYTLPSAEVITEDAIDGDDIYLTIDRNIQLFAEDLTRNLSNNYKMDWMVFTVMDAKTGAIVASSTYPNFDPNKLDINSYMNPLVSYEYEPGSTMKTFSFASSIEEGKYNGSATYKSGSITLKDGTTIKDHNKVGWGEITYDSGFVHSSNVAATKLAQGIGRDKLFSYYTNLGFGSKTGIELANEGDGKIAFTYESELATASFGQGITVTPIQMLQALSTLTNNGTTLKPYVVDKIINNKNEVIYEGKRTELNKVYSKETVDYMRKLMHKVVYEGTSKIWQPSNTVLIGKTGTAQIASPKGGYLKGDTDYIRSFAGIFPEEDPKYIVYIAVEKLGASSAAPIAKELTTAVDKIVSYLGLKDDNNEIINKLTKLNNYISKDVTTTVEDLKSKKLNVYVLGSGKYIINQYPLKNTSVTEETKIFLLTNNDDYVMTNLNGWSLNEVKTYCNLLNIELVTEGYGYVTSQSIEEGTAINSDSVLRVTLSK